MVKTLVLVSDSLFCAGVFGKQDLIRSLYTLYHNALLTFGTWERVSLKQNWQLSDTIQEET